ncbi:MAG: sortase [Acidimicrobiales bacterium]
MRLVSKRSSRPPGPALAPLPAGLDLLRAGLIVLCMVATAMALHLVFVSSLQHRSAQQRSYSAFRRTVAEGTAPLGPTDASGRQLRRGTPVAFLEIPSIGVKEVVGVGTTAADLMDGPGHRRDSPLPGQTGTSVVMGRQSAYGGPFNRLGDLKGGDKITMTTGQGVSRFTVASLRRGGEPTPPPLRSGQGRLLLISAAGTSYVPSQLLRVDANLDSPALRAPAPVITSKTLPPSERIMGTDPTTLWRLAFWLQALIAVALGIVWSWHRWGRAETWVVFLPVATLAGLFASAEALKLLPNLL